MNTYDGCCGSCIYLNTNDYVNHKDHCYCTYRKQYYNLTERKCSYYKYDPNKDYYDLNKRWHIVSIILAIIPEAKQIPGMAKLHRFRTDVLEKDQQYEKGLRIYDIIGPFLAREIALDVDRQQICTRLIDFYFKSIIQMINDSEYTKAFIKYINMVNDLSQHYSAALNRYMAIKIIPQNTLQFML